MCLHQMKTIIGHRINTALTMTIFLCQTKWNQIWSTTECHYQLDAMPSIGFMSLEVGSCHGIRSLHATWRCSSLDVWDDSIWSCDICRVSRCMADIILNFPPFLIWMEDSIIDRCQSLLQAIIWHKVLVCDPQRKRIVYFVTWNC